MRYYSRFSNNVKAITVICLALMLGLCVYSVVRALSATSQPGDEAFLIVTPMLLVLTGLTYLWSLRYYQATPEHLIIKLLGPTKKIPLDQILRIEQSASREGILDWIRLLGNGGLFGYFGWYYHTKYGRVKFYCGNLNQVHIIYLKGGSKIAISPDNVALFSDLKMVPTTTPQQP
jgi:hypothetical protein